jgi:hypothetical protein
MRLGQAVCDYVTLPSDPEIRLCIVPLREADYLQVLEKVNNTVAEDNLSGLAVRDRVQAQEIVARTIREEDDFTQRVYDSVAEMLEDLEVADVDEIYDRYTEMTQKSSPSLDGIPEGEMDEIKKLLQAMDWNVLSGRSWYAAKRFLSTIMPSPLLDNSPGSSLINSSTMTSESGRSTSIASRNSSKTDAKSAESQSST